MKFLTLTILIIFIAVPAVAAVDGQEIFQTIFYDLLSVFAVGITIGLAIKIINRS